MIFSNFCTIPDFLTHIVLFDFSEHFPFKVISTACIVKGGCEGILERWLSRQKQLGVQSSASMLDSSLFPVLQFQRFPEACPLLASAGTALPCIPIPLASSTPLLLHTHVQISFKECLSYSNSNNYKKPPPLPCKVRYVDSPESF